MALPLSRALNGTWNVDASRGESSWENTNFYLQTFGSSSRWLVKSLAAVDQDTFWVFPICQLKKAAQPSYFLQGAICVWSRGERILGEEFLGKSTHLAGGRSARHPCPDWENKGLLFPSPKLFSLVGCHFSCTCLTFGSYLLREGGPWVGHISLAGLPENYLTQISDLSKYFRSTHIFIYWAAGKRESVVWDWVVIWFS